MTLTDQTITYSIHFHVQPISPRIKCTCLQTHRLHHCTGITKKFLQPSYMSFIYAKHFDLSFLFFFSVSFISTFLFCLIYCYLFQMGWYHIELSYTLSCTHRKINYFVYVYDWSLIITQCYQIIIFFYKKIKISQHFLNSRLPISHYQNIHIYNMQSMR